jgi:glucose-6-phosphate isomerase
MTALTRAWTALAEHRRHLDDRRIADLVDADPARFDRFAIALGDVLFDFTKTKLDDRAVALLTDLAVAAGVAERREAMFHGEALNTTEDRAVLHVALRDATETPIRVNGADVKPEIAEVLQRTRRFAEDVRHGRLRSATGEPFTDVVNIGIGGSDLGPAMATRALAPYHDGPRVHFVANVDAADVTDTLAGLDPCRTLVLISSKTFTTVETMTNARSVWAWIAGAVGADAAGAHVAAISTARDKTAAFGIPDERVFGYWDWVGGRYSIWGPVGLPLMIAVGPERFDAFRAGAAEVDRHFRDAPLARNIPAMLGLIGVWHHNVCGMPTRAVLPYDQRLERLPAYIQQLDMESNGKAVQRDGEPLTVDSGPIVWGAVGTTGQHAFFQLLHQGTRIVPAEFLVAAQGHEPDRQDHHDVLVANCFAQSEALMRGRTREQAAARLRARGLDAAEAARLAPHRSFAGDRPSTTLLYPRLDPRMLGRILAIYEHRVFVEGTVWGINSFDQFGVELGKELATALYPMVRDGRTGVGETDAATAGLLDWYHRIVGWRGA